MSAEPLEFPPFVPAKPKGGVATEIAAAKPASTKGVEAEIKQYHLENMKPKRKRRTAAEMEAAGTPKKKKVKPRGASIPLNSLVAFAGLAADEIDQVVNACEAINTFPKAARKRIAAAIGQLFGQ